MKAKVSRRTLLLASIGASVSGTIGCGGRGGGDNNDGTDGINSSVIVPFTISDTLKSTANSVLHPSSSAPVSSSSIKVRGASDRIHLYTLFDQSNRAIAFSTTFGTSNAPVFNSNQTLQALLIFASLSNPTTIDEFNALTQKITNLTGFAAAEQDVQSQSGKPLTEVFSTLSLQTTFSTMLDALFNSGRSRAYISSAQYEFTRTPLEKPTDIAGVVAKEQHYFENEGYRYCRVIRRLKYGDVFFHERISDAMRGRKFDIIEWGLRNGQERLGDKYQYDFLFIDGLKQLDYFIVGPAFDKGNTELSNINVGGLSLDDVGDLWVATVFNYLLVPIFDLLLTGLAKVIPITAEISGYILHSLEKSGIFDPGQDIKNDPVGFVKNLLEWQITLAADQRFWELIGVSLKTAGLLTLTEVASAILAVLSVVNAVPNVVQCVDTLKSTQQVTKIPVPVPKIKKNVVVDGKFGFRETEWDTLTADKVVQDVSKTSDFLSEWSDGVSGSVKTQRHKIGPPSGTPKDVIHVDGTTSANIEFQQDITKYKINQHQYSRYIRCGISTHNWSSYFEVKYYVKGKRGTAFKYTASLTGSESGGQVPAQDPYDGPVNRYRMGVPSFRARTTGGNVKNFDWALEANKSNSFSELLGTGISTDEVTIDGEIYSYAMTVQINGSYGLGYSEIILCTIVPWDTAIANLDFNLKIEIA